jgi:hypothetical protein
MDKPIDAVAVPDGGPAFGWWTFGVLIAYTAALLVFCGVVTARHYSAADTLAGRLPAANPPHLPIRAVSMAQAELGGALLPRIVCYQAEE